MSLHAPNDALRTRIVPTNDKTGIADILAAADYFFAKTGRQVTYEYVLLGGLNDRPDARPRAGRRCSQGRKAHVNLIPFNDVEGLPYRRPTPEALTAFIDTLQAGRREREGPQAQGVGDRRRVRAVAAEGGAGSGVGRCSEVAAGVLADSPNELASPRPPL